MPKHLKLIVSFAAVVASVAMFAFDTWAAGGGLARWVALALGPLAVFAIWVFPEAGPKDVRREAAERRGTANSRRR